jgi:hypothetical protein
LPEQGLFLRVLCLFVFPLTPARDRCGQVLGHIRIDCLKLLLLRVIHVSKHLAPRYGSGCSHRLFPDAGPKASLKALHSA